MLHGSIYESMLYQSSDVHVHQSVQHSLPKGNMAHWSDSSNDSSGQKSNQKDAKAHNYWDNGQSKDSSTSSNKSWFKKDQNKQFNTHSKEHWTSGEQFK